MVTLWLCWVNTDTDNEDLRPVYSWDETKILNPKDTSHTGDTTYSTISNIPCLVLVKKDTKSVWVMSNHATSQVTEKKCPIAGNNAICDLISVLHNVIPTLSVLPLATFLSSCSVAVESTPHQDEWYTECVIISCLLLDCWLTSRIPYESNRTVLDLVLVKEGAGS